MKYLLLILCMFSTALQATEVYITRDANGNVTFSDKPGTNSQRHELRELPSIPAVRIPDTTPPPARVNEPSFNYTSLSIITPQNEQTVPTGLSGNVEISGVLSPGLRETDTIYLLANGNVLRHGRQTSFQLNNLDRGEYRLQLVVRDQDNRTLISSNPVTVYVQRASALRRAP